MYVPAFPGPQSIRSVWGNQMQEKGNVMERGCFPDVDSTDNNFCWWEGGELIL